MDIKEKGKINQIINALSLDDNSKKLFLEYLTYMNASGIDLNDNFVFRIPSNINNENFHLNKLIDISSNKKVQSTWEIISSTEDEQLKAARERIEKLKELSFQLKAEERVPSKESKSEQDYKAIEKIDILTKKIEECYKDIKNLNEENNKIKEILYNESSSYNSDTKIQIIPISIYIDTNDSAAIFGVYTSVLDFLTSIGFEKALEFKAIKGSWIKKMIAKSKNAITNENVTDRLKEAEYGIEVNGILKQQSEIDKNQSEALSNIITSLKDIPNAAIRIGALIVVKITDNEGVVNLQTRTLSIKELHLLNKKPELLQMPKQILQALAKEVDDNTPPQITEN